MGLSPAPPPRPYIPWAVGGRFDTSTAYGSTYTSAAIAANTMYAVPLIPISDVPGGPIGITAIAYRVGTGDAGRKCRLALYTMLASGYPGSLIAQSSQQVEDPGSNVTVEDTSFVATLMDGVPVYAVIWGDGAPTVVVGQWGSVIGNSGAFGSVVAQCWSVGSQTYTAGSSSFPPSFPGGAASTNRAVTILVRRGS